MYISHSVIYNNYIELGLVSFYSPIYLVVVTTKPYNINHPHYVLQFSSKK